MRVVLLDTNVVSILFKPDHSLYQKCFAIVSVISGYFIHDPRRTLAVAQGEPVGFKTAGGLEKPR